VKIEPKTYAHAIGVIGAVESSPYGDGEFLYWKCEPMPTILYHGWRFHFYSNEGNEPMHVHAIKGDAECKYWIHPDRFDITEDFEYNCTPRLRREVRQIIEHFGEDRAE